MNKSKMSSDAAALLVPSPADLDYAAGYFEARGSVRMFTHRVPSTRKRPYRYRRLIVRVNFADPAVGDFFTRLFSAGGTHSSGGKKRRPKKGWKAPLAFKVAGQPAVEALGLLRPYLRFRGPEVDAVLAQEAEAREVQVDKRTTR